MSEFLAEASILIRPNTASFRATLVAELAAATKGIVVPVNVVAAGGGARTSVKQVAVAQRELAAATTTANVATTEQVSVQRLAAATAAAEAKAQRAAAVAARQSAKAHETLARGVGATTLEQFGLRGATLAASKEFLIGAAAATILFKSVEEASAEIEATARAEKIFGERTRELEKDARGFAGAFGLSVTQTLAFEGALGNVLHVAGVAQERIPKLSEDLVKLGADVAAFNNVPVADVLKTFQLGILGNTRGLKSLGIELSAASVNQRALTQSGKENTAQLTTQDRELARISLLFERTVNQQGAAARRSHELAGETRTLKANLANLGATIGKLVIPVIIGLEADLNLLFDGFHKVGEGTSFLGNMLGNFAADLVEALPGGTHLMEDLGNALQTTTQAAEALAQTEPVIDLFTGKVITAGATWEDFLRIVNRSNFKAAELQIGSLQDKLLDLQFRETSGSGPTNSTTTNAGSLMGGKIDWDAFVTQELKKYNIALRRSKADGSGRMLEFYGKGESDSFDPSRPAIETFGKVSSKDIAGDLISHYLGQGADPKLTSYYNKFKDSLTNDQIETLHEQYEWAKKHEKEKRSYAQWAKMSGIPAAFRGYAFNQWPADFNKQFYTPEQTKMFDQLKAGLTTQLKSTNVQQAEIANLRAQIAAVQQAILTAPTVKAKTEAKEQRNQLKDQLDSILAQQEADAKNAVDDAKRTADDIAQLIQSAADFVQQKLQEARQALLDSFSLEQGRNDLQATRAQGTKSLVDDLAALEARRAILRREIGVAREAGLDALTVLGLQQQLAQTQNQIGALEAQQAANRQQRRQIAFDRAAESVDLDIQLAQTNKNIRSEIAARQRRIRLDEERAKSVRGDILATKRLRNDIAEQKAAIADLRKQLGDRNRAFQALSFEFLQTQSGFAANLISNLIPGGSTAGLVGGAASAISTPTLSPERSRPPDVGAGLGAAAQTSGPRGATTGQMSALIEIQRRTLQVLTRLAGEQTHPEAKNQKIAQAASMDIINW